MMVAASISLRFSTTASLAAPASPAQFECTPSSLGLLREISARPPSLSMPLNLLSHNAVNLLKLLNTTAPAMPRSFTWNANRLNLRNLATSTAPAGPRPLPEMLREVSCVR